MNIKNIIDAIKNEYLNLLDGNLEVYTVEAATQSLIDEFSSKFKLKLPDDFVFFITHSDIKIAIENGYDSIDIESTDYKLEKMNKWLDEGAFDGKIENIDGDPSPLMKNVWWNKKWIPFAEDGGGNLLCIDLDPGEQGVSGQIIGFERGSGPYPTEFKSFGEFLNCQLEFTKKGGLQGSSDGTLS